MNNVLKGILTALLSLFLLVYVGYQAYLTLYHNVKTERVYKSTVSDIITAKGFVIHDETVINASVGSGVIDYTRENGERVSNGGVVANIFATAQDAENQQKLDQLSNKIASLKDADSGGNASLVDVNMLENEIDETFLNLASDTSVSGLGALYDTQSALLELLNKKQLATGAVTDFNAKIAALQQQSAAISAKISSSTKSIKASVSGCFVNSTDGYEGSYDTSKILNISVADVNRLMTSKPQVKSGAIGKIVSEYEWYITCVLDESDARKLKVGASLNAQFLFSSESGVPVTVAAINQSGGSYAVVLKCEYMTNKLAAMRMQTLQITANEYTGIKISNNYIHVVDNQKGVFVQDGNTAEFKKIVPIYSGNGYTVSSINSSDSSMLQVYDELIVNGDGLYDGKLIK